MSGTARIGPMLVTGLLGATTTRSARSRAVSTPGAGAASAAPWYTTSSIGGTSPLTHDEVLEAEPP
jgi:hypothetical protein